MKNFSKKEYLDILNQTTLFRDLKDTDLQEALSFFQAEEANYLKGEPLYRIGDPFVQFGLVLEGAVQVSTNDLDGEKMIMATVTPGETFGESLCFLQANDREIYIHAIENVSLLWLKTDNIRSGAKKNKEIQLINRFISMLAERTLYMNSRIQILCRNRLRGKLIAFFTECEQKAGSNLFNIPFDRKDMAAYLGTDRSALSRELSQMKAEGLIDYYKNSFRLYLPTK